MIIYHFIFAVYRIVLSLLYKKGGCYVEKDHVILGAIYSCFAYIISYLYVYWFRWIGADKQHFIFTPQNATEYSQISEIDKLLFAFSIQPIVTIVFLLSIVYVLTLIVFQIIECKKEKKILHSL